MKSGRDNTQSMEALIALVEERTRLLPVPGRCEVARAVFGDLDLSRHLSGEELDRGPEPFFRPQWDVVPGEDA